MPSDERVYGINVFSGEYAPAAVGTAEVIPTLSLREGDIVLYAYLQKLVLAAASTTTTVSLGDGGSVARFVAATDTETGAIGDIVTGVVANFPFQYTVDDRVDIDYAAITTPGTVNPRWRVFIVYMRPLDVRYGA